MNKLRIRLLEKCDHKLKLVKLIKDCTGLGLSGSYKEITLYDFTLNWITN